MALGGKHVDYYVEALEIIKMVPQFQLTTSISESSPMEKVKKIADEALAGNDLKPYRTFLESFDPEEEDDGEEG
jgi:hypothetical protein